MEKTKKEMKRGLNKRGQMTIFILLGILIVAVILILFIQNENVKSIFTGGKSPVEKMEDCLKDDLEEGLEILRLQGGVIGPKNYYLYEDNKIEYVCYTNENYKLCTMQKPLLKNSIEQELLDYAEPKIKDCMDNVKISLEEDGSQVSMKEPEIKIEIFPREILTEAEIDMTVTKGNSVDSYKEVRNNIKTNMYNFVMIASSIMAWETRYGDSDILTYMLYYPDIKVEKYKQIEGTKIYIITDRNSKEVFMFATRSMTVPAGMIEVKK